jgi:AcrR family transcriptional regulator
VPAGRLTAKGQRTRQRIVAAAAGLVFERGVAGTTIEDVQAAAGVSASQLYHYFPSKNAVVRAEIDTSKPHQARRPAQPPSSASTACWSRAPRTSSCR